MTSYNPDGQKGREKVKITYEHCEHSFIGSCWLG